MTTAEHAPETTRSLDHSALEQVLNGLADPVMVKDESHRLVFVNQAFCAFLGRRQEELLGRPDDLAILPALLATVHAQDEQVLQGGEPLVAELTYAGPSGRERVLAVQKSRVVLPDGRRLVVSCLRDITAARRTRTELVQAREEALRASRAKTDFLAVMSHELRTPLSGVLGLAELLGDTPLDEAQRDMATTLRSAAESLQTLIDDLLDFSKIEAGRLEVLPAPFDLQAVLRAVDVPMSLRAQQKGLAYARHLASATPTWRLGDAARLQQVLRNLVANAVKFSERGRVEVRVTPALDGPGPACLRFEVIDTGPGIPLERQPELFQPFVQLDRRAGGSGLGLAVCHRLVEAMGGRLGLESAPGLGSRFWFELPLPVAAEPLQVAEVAPASPARPLQVLLAEDDPTNQQVAVRSLERLGHRVDVVANGCAALKALSIQRYDLVLMDLQMPEMDGFEATRRIRAGDGVLDPQVPVVGLTAFAMPQDRTRCLAAGMNDHVPKPYRVRELAAAIARLRPEQPPPQGAGAEPARPPPVFDRAALEERVGSEREVLAGLAVGFVAEADRQLASLRAAFAQPDPDQLRARAHRLKGAAGSLGAMRLCAALAVLEREARCCETEHLGERLEVLERELEALRVTLAREGLLPIPGAPAGGSR
ncbi:MAG TPA: ATP-binding protein [Myxococcota bacterium]|nr:ATP-binding protein [Myxococcota bacterium]HRY94725.1 ATP-binding protein [Myxococcota bacterium]HSA20052.1 ATP-binding protein [Myxococcota bacterium]